MAGDRAAFPFGQDCAKTYLDSCTSSLRESGGRSTPSGWPTSDAGPSSGVCGRELRYAKGQASDVETGRVELGRGGGTLGWGEVEGGAVFTMHAPTAAHPLVGIALMRLRMDVGGAARR